MWNLEKPELLRVGPLCGTLGNQNLRVEPFYSQQQYGSWVSISCPKSGTWTLEPWNAATLEPWNPAKALEPWDPGTLQPSNPGSLEPWNLNPGNLEPYWIPNPQALDALELWNSGSLRRPGLESSNPQMLEPWTSVSPTWHGTLEPPTLTWNLRTFRNLQCGTLRHNSAECPRTLSGWDSQAFSCWGKTGTDPLGPGTPQFLEYWTPGRFGTMRPSFLGTLQPLETFWKHHGFHGWGCRVGRSGCSVTGFQGWLKASRVLFEGPRLAEFVEPYTLELGILALARWTLQLWNDLLCQDSSRKICPWEPSSLGPEPWNPYRILGLGASKLWKSDGGSLEPLELLKLETWEHGNFWNFYNFWTLEPWNLETLEPFNFQFLTLQLRNLGGLEHKNLVTLDFGTFRTPKPKTLKP